MNFDLTEEIKNQIIFAMEDQGTSYVFDAVQLKTVPAKDFPADEDRYYSIPGWDSMSGFRLMERFVDLLRNPMARESLRGVLYSGRGVFKGFKLVLKEYPEVERLWHSFKDRSMNQTIVSWYNALLESWGLEHLEEEPDDDAELVHDDFVFRVPASETDEDAIFLCASLFVKELEDIHPGEPGRVISELWENQRYAFSEESEYVMLAETVDGDFAGCITVGFGSQSNAHTGVLTSLYVMPRYRGLGVGRVLVEKCQEELHEKDVQWILTGSSAIPAGAATMLSKCGFEPMGTGLILNLAD